MKQKNAEAYDAFSVMQQTKETGLLGFAIAKNMRKLANELVEYDGKRTELLQKYGTPAEGNQYEFTKENAKLFYGEMAQYDSLEIEIEPMTVPEEVFCGGNLTSDQMYALMWMVKE